MDENIRDLIVGALDSMQETINELCEGDDGWDSIGRTADLFRQKDGLFAGELSDAQREQFARIAEALYVLHTDLPRL